MIEDWNKLTEKITQEWIKKYFNLSLDEDLDYYWVAGDIGTVFEFADYFFDFQNVLDCFRYSISKDNLFNWYEACLSDSSFQLSLANFILKPEELKEQQRLSLKKSKENLEMVEKEFKKNNYRNTLKMDKIEFTVAELKEMALESMKQMVLKAVDKNRENINNSLDEYFKKSWVSNKANKFEDAFDWALENCFREGLKVAMEDMDLKQLIVDKAKEMLTDDVIKELAHKKVKASLGL